MTWMTENLNGHIPQVEEFKYLGILFTSEGEREWKCDRWIREVSAVMQMLKRSVVADERAEPEG